MTIIPNPVFHLAFLLMLEGKDHLEFFGMSPVEPAANDEDPPFPEEPERA